MSRIAAIFMLIALSCCSGSNKKREAGSDPEPVTLEVFNSLRIRAHRVKITMTASGLMSIEVQDKGGATAVSNRIIEQVELANIQQILRKIDWREVSDDEVFGLDGASVRVSYLGANYSVWTPAHDTEKRHLQNFLKLEQNLLRLAELNE